MINAGSESIIINGDISAMIITSKVSLKQNKTKKTKTKTEDLQYYIYIHTMYIYNIYDKPLAKAKQMRRQSKVNC